MTLGIETATATLSVALVHEGVVLASTYLRRKNMHDELLAPLIDETLELAGITGAQLDAVAVSSGPGSFTGLRIGMAAAKGIAVSLGVPLVAVPTFDALALRIASSGVPSADTGLLIAFDARRGDVYNAVYAISGGKARQLKAPSVDAMQDAVASVRKGTWICGDAASMLMEAYPGTFRALEGPWSDAHAEAVALLGEHMAKEGIQADVADCEPLYLRDFRTTTPKA